jgi:hypothetical protein
MFGVWLLFLGVILAILFYIYEPPRVIQALVFIPFFLGFLGIIQAQRRTCVVLALKGKQNLDTGPEDILVPHTRDVLKMRSYGILLSAALLAAGVTAVLIVLPRPGG